MANSSGSTTPTQDSYLRSRKLSPVPDSLLDYVRECSSWALRRPVGWEEAADTKEKVVTCQSGYQGLARRHGLVPWNTKVDPNRGSIPTCHLPQSLISVRNTARAFHHAHQEDWPTLTTAADWLDYVENITALGTEWKKHRGIISVPDTALDRARSLTAFAQTDLYTLNTLIANAEDVMTTSCFRVPLGRMSWDNDIHGVCGPCD